jgi:tRNA (adenine57-N1/adenine58-N1)-methyltransferase
LLTRRAERPFQSGELALLVDRNGKHYVFRLQVGGEYHFHQGGVRHDEIIGQEEGVQLFTALGRPVWAYRPRLQDYLMHMPRNSAIMYPKDIAFILMWADIFPGARVFEAGAGSGALSLALLRAIGPQGSLVTYEARTDMIERATANVYGWAGATPNWTLRQLNAYQGIVDGPFDRVVLDLPEPGRVAPHLAETLAPGGLVCSYVPNVTQVQASAEGYRTSGLFVEIETYEVWFRSWLFRDQSARPEHGMVGHTGFVTLARRSGSDPSSDAVSAIDSPDIELSGTDPFNTPQG